MTSITSESFEAGSGLAVAETVTSIFSEIKIAIFSVYDAAVQKTEVIAGALGVVRVRNFAIRRSYSDIVKRKERMNKIALFLFAGAILSMLYCALARNEASLIALCMSMAAIWLFSIYIKRQKTDF